MREHTPGEPVHYSPKGGAPYRLGAYVSTDIKGRHVVKDAQTGQEHTIGSARVKFLDDECAAATGRQPVRGVSHFVEPMTFAPTSLPEYPIEAVLRRTERAIEKQGKPEISDVYRQWVKQGKCCNCGAYPTDPHHEDTTIGTLKRGKGQKARDTLCVSLCRPCHDALTGIGGGYLLPRPDGGEHTHAESKAILHDAQEERLRIALGRFPQEWRIEILSKGIACVPEGVKRAALLTGDVDDRLADALDSAGEEPI